MIKEKDVDSCHTCPVGRVYRADDMDWAESVWCPLLPRRDNLFIEDPPKACSLRNGPVSVTFKLRLIK